VRRIAVFALLLTACTTTRPPRVDHLTLDEKIGQLFVYAAHGNFMNEGSPAYAQLRRQVRENKVGGIIWFVSNVYETAHLNRKLQAEARVPLLVSADLEAGVGMRFTNTTYWPPAMAVAATGDPSLAEREGKIAAAEARLIGINHILAPVADVNVDPDNPVINARSFGEDPESVGRFVAAFVRGAQSEPVLATAKHFPGHGDTHVDTHRSLPVLSIDRARLDRVELVPFRAAIDAGVASIMMGHLGIPALDPTPAPVRNDDEAASENVYTEDPQETTRGGTVPASLSPRVVTDLLRRDLGFDGLVVGDAFDMGALVAHFDAGEAAIRALEAGDDMILKSANTDAAIAAVRAAVQSGRLSEARIDQSVARILRAKQRVSASVGTDEEIFRGVDTPEHQALASEIASRAITLVREEDGVLPLRRDQRIVIVSVSDFPEVMSPLPGAEGEVRRRTAKAPETFLIDARTRMEEIEPMIAATRNADVVILALAIRAVSGAGQDLRLPDTAVHLARSIPPSVKTLAVAFGSPYLLRDLPQLRTYVCAYGGQAVLQTAAVKALFGERSITGKLPVTIPGLHARGEGIEKRIDATH
jgi:beta-glucosidase-like glycosyl hydrolase